MSEIRLNSLEINNFKGVKHFALCPNGENIDIYGDNATGKTTVYDAFMWLLFDRDSLENTQFDIKPLDENGDVVSSGSVTSVEAELLIDGELINLRKTYYEKWSQKRGSADKTFDGNTSDYFVDEVPVKKKEYEQRISEFINKETFRLLTNVSYFAKTLSWQKRREILFEICGLPNDQKIMETEEKFSELINAVGKGSVEELKKKLSAKRRGLNETRVKIPIKIESIENTMLPYLELPYESLAMELETVSRKRDEAMCEKREVECDTAVVLKKTEIAEVKSEISKLRENNARHREEQQRNFKGTGELDAAIASLLNDIKSIETQKDRLLSYAKRREERVAQLRTEWSKISAKKFSGETICPMCGREYPKEKMSDARASFEAHKAAELEEVAKRASEEKEQLEYEYAEANKLIDSLSEKSEELSKLREEKKNAPVLIISDMPGYAETLSELSAKLSSIHSEYDALMGEKEDVLKKCDEKIKIYKLRAAEITEKLSGQTFIKQCKDSIEQLRTEAKEAAVEMEGIDTLIYLCEEYTKYKVSFVTDAVNGMFNLAKFKLFETQINGGINDCCSVVYEGADFETNLNSGAKISVGMDIINTLSERFGVSVPLFIDNAESVTNIPRIDTQVIRLVVSKDDKKLRCEKWDW